MDHGRIYRLFDSVLLFSFDGLGEGVSCNVYERAGEDLSRIAWLSFDNLVDLAEIISSELPKHGDAQQECKDRV